MATTSFTLRKTSVGFGSYVQKTGLDSALRSDQYIEIETAGTATTSTFSANIISPSEVLLSWDLSFSFVTSASSPNPIALAIVASPTGEPVTVKDGELVYQTSSNSNLSTEDIVRVSEGRWVYYSLFIKWSDFDTTSPTTWYERAATVYVQVPKRYNSVDNLWSRIPEHYRILDAAEPNNPLYNFIELFGWELDRTRTLIDTVALSNDPELAVTPALKELAYETGLEFDVDTLGTTKARALLTNIGYLRRRKGTIESITAYLSAITGCQISYQEIDQVHFFRVHSQRINFVPDSRFSQAPTFPITGSSPSKTNLTLASTWGVYTYASSTSNAASVSTNGSAVTVSVPAGGTGNTTVVLYSNLSFPYYEPAYLYTAFVPTFTGGASFSAFHLTTPTINGAPWEDQSAGTPYTAPIYDTWNTSPLLLGTDPNAPGRYRVELAPNSASVTPVSVYPYLVFTVPNGGSVTVTDWMVEPYSIGDYFDGNTREGGLIPQTSGYGTGISDYRWDGTEFQSYSYYTLDYQRVYTVAENIIKNYIAPVTVKDIISISWNYYYRNT
jgi:hypothetical protein